MKQEPNETGTAPIVLVDGIGEFIVGSECFEVLVIMRPIPVSKNNWHLELCSWKKYEYGGHWHWLSKILMRTIGIDELTFSPCWFQFGYYHCWYDGQQHSLFLGLLWIGWEGKPLLDC